MNLELRTKGVEISQRLRASIERRLRFALSRYGRRLRDVRVLLQDINGPRGGEDIRCRIHATLAAPGADLVVEETRESPFAAAALAADRASHGIARRISRLHSRRRGRR